MQTKRSEEKDFVGTQIFQQLLQGHARLRNVVKLFKAGSVNKSRVMIIESPQMRQKQGEVKVIQKCYRGSRLPEPPQGIVSFWTSLSEGQASQGACLSRHSITINSLDCALLFKRDRHISQKSCYFRGMKCKRTKHSRMVLQTAVNKSIRCKWGTRTSQSILLFVRSRKRRGYLG